jgi:hypothetical protein
MRHRRTRPEDWLNLRFFNEIIPTAEIIIVESDGRGIMNGE